MTKFMNAELENLRKRLHGNKLTLSVAKKRSMIISTKGKLHQSNSREFIQAHFKIPGEAIEQKKSLKYLGVILGNQLKWKDHISLTSWKVSRAIGMVKYAKNYYRPIYYKCFI